LKFPVSLCRTSLRGAGINTLKPRIKYRELLTNNIDGVVADGFTDNIVHKTLEGNVAVDLEMVTTIKEATVKNI
jgi:fatty acid/phospholipid biosynthesis enzyme